MTHKHRTTVLDYRTGEQGLTVGLELYPLERQWSVPNKPLFKNGFVHLSCFASSPLALPFPPVCFFTFSFSSRSFAFLAGIFLGQRGDFHPTYLSSHWDGPERQIIHVTLTLVWGITDAKCCCVDECLRKDWSVL